MTTDDAHAILAGEALARPLTEDDTLALMILLHTHRILFRAPILEDRPGVMGMDAITQRDVADVAARLWPDRADTAPTDYRHWYWLFNTHTPYEVVEDIPRDWARRVERLRSRLERHPQVAAVQPEED